MFKLCISHNYVTVLKLAIVRSLPPSVEQNAVTLDQHYTRPSTNTVENRGRQPCSDIWAQNFRLHMLPFQKTNDCK